MNIIMNKPSKPNKKYYKNIVFFYNYSIYTFEDLNIVFFVI